MASTQSRQQGSQNKQRQCIYCGIAMSMPFFLDEIEESPNQQRLEKLEET
jgi:hypothetical protein